MDFGSKLSILADAAKYDASCAGSGTTKRNSRDGGLGSTTGAGICHSYTPDGRGDPESFGTRSEAGGNDD